MEPSQTPESPPPTHNSPPSVPAEFSESSTLASIDVVDSTPCHDSATASSEVKIPELAVTPPEDNPWKNSVVNVEFKDMSNRLFNFGPVPWPGDRDKVAQGKSSWISAGTSISTEVQDLNKNLGPVRNPVPPLGQRVSLGYMPPPPIIQQQKKPLEIVYKLGGTPRVNLASDLDAVSHETITHLNGSVYHELAGVCTPCDTTAPGMVEKLLKIANDDVPKILNQRRFASIKSNLRTTLIIRDLEKNDPHWHFLDFDRGLYIEPNPMGIENADILVENLTTKFWEDLEAFPMHYTFLPHDIEVDFLMAMSFGANERVLGWNDTPFPFSDVQIQRLVQVYRDLKRQADAGDVKAFPPLVWHIARTMVKIEEYRTKAKFGTPDYQLYRPVVAVKTSWKVKTAERGLMLALFGAHRTYRMRLQGARVRGTIYLADFRELLRSFLVEWSDSNLLATVFVGANIAFLAAPGVNNLQRTASLASTICSLTSIVTGVHHIWQHRTKVNANYEEARQYLSHLQPLDDGHDSDLAVTAIFLSVPLVALLYAVLSFSVALGAYCVQNSEIHGKLLLVVLFGLTGLTGIVTLIFFWHVWRGPRTVQISDEDIDVEMAYGWKTIFQRRMRRGRKRVGKVVQRVGHRLSRVGAVIADGKHAPLDVEIPRIQTPSNAVKRPRRTP